MMVGVPIKSGRTLLTPVNVLMFVVTLKGLPLWIWLTTTTCQPSLRRLPWNGSSYVALMLNLCRTSKSDGPSLPAMLKAS